MRPSLTLLLVVAALVAALVVWRVTVLCAIGEFLAAEDTPAPADVIVVLAGSVPDRILAAVDLYNAKLAPRLLLTREPPLPGIEALRARGVSMPEPHEENVMIATRLGVPAEAITQMPTPATSTLAEARAVVPFLVEHGWPRVLLVTSKAHARRARMTFQHVAGSRLHIAACPSPYDPFDATSWWEHRAYVRRVVIEYGKLLNFLLIDRWRSQPDLS